MTDIYHLMSRVDPREEIFRDDLDMSISLWPERFYRTQFMPEIAVVILQCLMPNCPLWRAKLQIALILAGLSKNGGVVISPPFWTVFPLKG